MEKFAPISMAKENVFGLFVVGQTLINFGPLMQKLAKQGYCCIAMEMLPDNKAHNRLFSLANWTNVFDVAARSVPEPNHVLAHGLGASIIGNSQWLTEYDEDLTLVSPALDLSTSLDMF
eukprot:TRINITY_DN6020_c0_g1_i1.p1 TRINITY_DN6020_c0_g1~~TRINITY_DN6020_c0_g1_i1.p1  ORF type:complete len:119 (+),score=7.61 TRINITY_DN6020_c0_g1_i1:103-459(+)